MKKLAAPDSMDLRELSLEKIYLVANGVEAEYNVVEESKLRADDASAQTVYLVSEGPELAFDIHSAAPRAE